jgi:hypothetical protein
MEASAQHSIKPHETNHAQAAAPSQRNFTRRLALFISPLLLIVGVVEALLWNCGETWTIEKTIHHQQLTPGSLFMRGILDQGFYRYKFLNILKRRPKILVLGSSRVMEFRKEMFGERGDQFYNAGGMIHDLGDLKAFIDNLQPDTTPEVVILGLDLWWFNPSRLTGEGFSKGTKEDAALDWQEHVRAWRKYKSKRGWKPTVRALSAKNQNVGIESRNEHVGFRYDGSMQYNFPLPQSTAEWKFVDREKPAIVERIRTAEGQFPAANEISEERLALLERCLTKLAQKNILVLGFAPPFSSQSQTLLEQRPGQQELWNGFRVRVPEIFKRHGQPFVDGSKPAELGLDDRYLVDGIHGAETFHLHVLLRFLEQPDVVNKLGPLNGPIRLSLSSQATNPWVPDYEPMRRSGKLE